MERAMFSTRSVTATSLPRHAIAAFALTALLAACGGGGGGGHHNPQQPQQPAPPAEPPKAERGPLYDYTPLGLPGITYGDVVRQGIADGGLVAGTSWDAAGNTRAFFFNGKTNIDLGSFGGNGSRAFSVNRCGQVTGWAAATDGLPHAFYYYNGNLRDLGTLGGGDSYGNAINTCGRVAGWGATAAGQWHAFYHDGTTMRDLGTFGGSSSFSLAVNNVGQVAGYAYGPGDAWYHAFLYDARTGAPIQDLGTLSQSSLAQDINDAGQIVGYSRSTAGDLRAFRFDGGTMHDLGLPTGAQGSEARAINAGGWTVGYVYYPDARQIAFVHDGNTLRELGTLGAGGRFSDAVAINKAGLVVGSSTDPASNSQHATTWTDAYGLVDLNARVKDLPKEVVLVAALAVADDGAIVVRTNGGLGLLRPRK
jgi:probable HAF family extracellular repeat protein